MLADAKIALVSPSGWGNLGDAAILDSLIGGICLRLPRARILAFTLNARGTARDHGLEAHTLLGFSPLLYTMIEAEEQRPSQPGLLARAWRKLPGHAKLELPLDEWAHYRRSRELLRGASAVVVAGGGQLDDFFGGPLGQPWALLRYGRLAKEVGAKFFFASVGTGTLSRASRAIALRALQSADYRSYRDEPSRSLLRAPRIVGADPIVPDLAYGYPVQPPRGRGQERLTVGISPMSFGDPRQWPEKDAARYRRHFESFAALARTQLARGNQVILFSTGGDATALDDTAAAIGDVDRARLRIEPTPTLESLFAAFAKMDVAVAARLHGVLLAHLAHLPVLAVAHERKVRTLMEQMDQPHFCIGIDDFTAEQGQQRLEELIAQRRELSRRIAEQVQQRRAEVEAQYDRLFAAG